MRSAPLLALLVAFAACTPAARTPVASPAVAQTEAMPLRFRVSAPAGAAPAAGRIVLAMTNVPAVADPLAPPTIFADVNDIWYAAVHVNRLAAGEPITVDADLFTAPARLPHAPEGKWRVAASFEPDPSPAVVFTDSLRSPVVEKMMDPLRGGVLDLALAPAKKDAAATLESDTTKIVHAPSKRLSAFYGRPMTIDAVVLLPASYAGSGQRAYGTYYDLPGWGPAVPQMAANADKIEKFGPMPRSPKKCA